MSRLAVALAPLVLAVSAFSAQAQDTHTGHTMPATAAPARPAQDPHAGHVMPPAQTPPAADPHAGHRMPAQPAPVDPQAGHQMPAATPGQADPHAGHDMSAMSPAQTDPHAGHSMPAQAAATQSGVTTAPANGAMTQGSPERFSVTFPHTMVLKTVTLTAEGQAPVEVSVPAAPAAATVGVALPRLAPGTYTAAWTAEGPDGHKMSGSVSFMVH